MAVGSLEIALKVQTREATKQLDRIGDSMLRAGKKSKDTSAQFKSLQDILSRVPGSGTINFFKNLSTNARKAREESLKLSAQIAKLQARLRAGTAQRPFLAPAEISKIRSEIGSLNEKFRQTSSTLRNFYGPIAFTALSNAIDLASRALRTFIALMAKALAAAIEQDQAYQKLFGVLRASNRLGVNTFNNLIERSEELQKRTVFADKAIQEAMARLATFPNVVGRNFQRATETALDLAAVMGSSANQAALQLGRALNDPVGALDLLTQSGINFSERQKEVIQYLAETGQEARAASFILDELNERFGDTAEALAYTGVGALRQFQQQLTDTTEELGILVAEGLKPATTALTAYLKELTPTTEKQKELTDEIRLQNALYEASGKKAAEATKQVGGYGEALGISVPILKSFVEAFQAGRMSGETLGSIFGLTEEQIEGIKQRLAYEKQQRDLTEENRKRRAEDDAKSAEAERGMISRAQKRLEIAQKRIDLENKETERLKELAENVKDQLDVTRELTREWEDIQELKRRSLITDKQALEFVEKQIKEIEDQRRKEPERRRTPRDFTVRGFDSALEGAMAMNRRILTAAASREDVTVKFAEETARNTRELSVTQKETLDFWVGALEWLKNPDRARSFSGAPLR